MTRNHETHGFFYVSFFIYLALAMGGLAVSLYLALSQYRVYTDIGYQSFCALSKALNCDTVSQSPYAIMLDLPVPVWGIIGYLFITVLALLARPCQKEKAPLWNLLFCLGILFSLYSLVLAGISSFIIKSYCLMCILSYGINFGLAFWSWVILKRFGHLPFIQGFRKDIDFLMGNKSKTMAIVAGFSLLLVFLFTSLPKYWEIAYVGNPSISHLTGTTKEGHPWIGSAKPIVEITEFTDYRCFQCKKMHFYLRRLLDTYPEKLRIVHRHFPMDHVVNPLVKKPYHEGAGLLALIAIEAQRQGKFWHTNDIIYRQVKPGQNISVNQIATEAGFEIQKLMTEIKKKNNFDKLMADIQAGLELEIVGTPAYLIAGKVYQGGIPQHAVQAIHD